MARTEPETDPSRPAGSHKRRLNKLAAYGHVTPPERGAVFYQDGAYFSSEGRFLWQDRPPTPKKVITNETTVIDSETKQSTTTETEVEVDNLPPGEPKDILTKWQKGEIEDGLKVDVARELVKKAYGQSPGSKEELIGFLVNKANLVSAEQVKVK